MNHALFKLSLKMGAAQSYSERLYERWIEDEHKTIERLIKNSPGILLTTFDNVCIPFLDTLKKNSNKSWMNALTSNFKLINEELKDKNVSPSDKEALIGLREKNLQYFLSAKKFNLKASYSLLGTIFDQKENLYIELNQKYNFTYEEHLFAGAYLSNYASIESLTSIASLLLAATTTKIEQSMTAAIFISKIIPGLIYQYKTSPLKLPSRLNQINEYISMCENFLPSLKDSSIDSLELFKKFKAQDISSWNNILPRHHSDGFKEHLTLELETLLLKNLNQIDPKKFEQKYLTSYSYSYSHPMLPEDYNECRRVYIASSHPVAARLDYSDIDDLMRAGLSHGLEYTIKLFNAFHPLYANQHYSPVHRLMINAAYFNDKAITELFLPQNRTTLSLQAQYPGLSLSAAQVICAQEGKDLLKEDLFRTPNDCLDMIIARGNLSYVDKVTLIEQCINNGDEVLYSKIAHWPHIDVDGAMFFNCINSVLQESPKYKNEAFIEKQKNIIKLLLKKEGQPGYYLLSHKKGLIKLSPDLIEYLTALKEKQELSALTPSKELEFVPRIKQKI